MLELLENIEYLNKKKQKIAFDFKCYVLICGK